ncbi:MAG TPA: tetratricopeptide repeat protein [Pseudogulbenkiania sp.]|nr:tetratricopeptide repeat protein [Pseudogulbenkiania sp.]
MQEQEQIDELKAFWAQWGKWISAAVLAAALGYLGTKGWTYYQQSQAEKASAVYDDVASAAQAGDLARLKSSIAVLQSDYGRTAYASRAALLVAKAAFDKQDLALAKSQLGWAVEHASEPALQAVARLRLAAVLLDEKRYDAAITELSQEHASAFDALFLDLKGDVYTAKGDSKAARDQYKSALAKLVGDSPSRQYIQTKLDALGG